MNPSRPHQCCAAPFQLSGQPAPMPGSAEFCTISSRRKRLHVRCRPASAGVFRNAAPQSRAGLESVDDRLVDLDVVLDEDQVFTFGPRRVRSA